MDKQSSSINQWTKGSHNDSKSTQKTDFNSKSASNFNSFEFLDMSACDETQKLKLKNTLSSPSSYAATSAPPRERYRSNFASRNAPVKPTPQQYSAVPYHANNSSKSQKSTYPFYQPNHPNDMMMRHVSRSFSSDANTFSSKNNSNFNNNLSALSNTTNISSKRLDDNRPHYPNTQEKLSKWHSNNKKPPYVGLKEPTQLNQKEAPLKRTAGPYHQPKESTREPNKNYQGGNRNMSPTNFPTNTTTSTTNSSSSSSISMSNQQSNVSAPHQAHFSAQQIPYGAAPVHPMYASGTVPLISHYPLHAGYMGAPPGQQMIPTMYAQHPDRGDMQNDHQSNSSSQHQMSNSRGGRRGRSRGGNNNMNRRDYQMRQSNQHHQQQNQSSSNDYIQPLMEQSPQVMNSGPYQPSYFIQVPYGYAPNHAGQVTAVPGSGNAANAQNLTGQPLFAFQQPFMYANPYGSPYVMYNMVPPPAHPMAHQQDMTDSDHNQNQEPGGTTPTTVIQSMPWPHHVAYPEPPIFQHSPHLSAGDVDLEYQVTHPDDYHMLVNQPNNYHIIADQHGAVNEMVQTDQVPLEDSYVDVDGEPAVEQQMYQQDIATDNGETDALLIEKTRDLMIQTSPQDVSVHPHIPQQPAAEEFDAKIEHKVIVPNPLQDATALLSPHSPSAAVAGGEPVENSSSPKVVIDRPMIVKNKEKPPAWGGAGVVPNLVAQGTVKKQTASVSVSAIPNKDVLSFQPEMNEMAVSEVAASSAPAGDKDHLTQTSFSSIIASKQPLSSPTFVDIKKTESKQIEIQPLQQKQQQMALSERAKQQIVTTITGVGAATQPDSNKKVEATSPRAAQSPQPVEEAPVVVSKVVEAPKPSPPAATAQSSASRASWAALFAGEGGPPQPRVHHQQQQQQPQPAPVPAHHQPFETQKATTAKNPETLPVQPPPQVQVPGVMSYSAVSAQSLPPTATVNYAAPASTIPSQLAAGGVPLSKNLPQSKTNSTNNNNIDNHSKSAPVDQHAIKLGDFFSKYKIESNSISLLPRGLLNKSNYCYINAILQALVACPPFYHLMKSIPQMPLTYKSHTKTPVTDAMVELVSNYSQLPYRKFVPRDRNKKDDVPEIARDHAFEPTVILRMLQALRTDMFPVEGRQEDAEEFLSFILNRMNDEMIELKKLVEKPKAPPKKEENGGDDVNGNTDASLDDDEEWQVISGARNKSTITRTTDFGRSPISDIFGGKLRLRVHREGDHSSDNIEPFFTLKLVIEKASSVHQALEILVGRDQLEGVTCSRTNQEVAAWQQVTLEELPVVLILHLKCFDFKKESCNKILKTVEFPVELKLDPKIIAQKNKYQTKQKQYKLFAVVYHDGKEASKGHYITDVFHVGYSNWIRYDDSSVKPVAESNVLHPKSPRVPYLLYYRRYDTIGGNRDHCNNHQANQKSTK